MHIKLRCGSGGSVISEVERSNGDGAGAAESILLTLAFAQGQRPDVDALARLAGLAGATPQFSLSHVPPASEGWAELLAMGLTFDCTGLAPAEPAAMPAEGALLGLERAPVGEAIGLGPGPHLADAAGMIPVLRMLTGIGTQLATLPGVQAVCWNPARCWMPVDYFRKVIAGWIAGGPFPALGLTTLQRESDGAIVSVGLNLLIGQELRFDPAQNFAAPDIARIAVRLIHALIETGRLDAPHEFIGPDRETLQVAPSAQGQQLSVSVRK